MRRSGADMTSAGRAQPNAATALAGADDARGISATTRPAASAAVPPKSPTTTRCRDATSSLRASPTRTRTSTCDRCASAAITARPAGGRHDSAQPHRPSSDASAAAARPGAARRRLGPRLLCVLLMVGTRHGRRDAGGVPSARLPAAEADDLHAAPCRVRAGAPMTTPASMLPGESSPARLEKCAACASLVGGVRRSGVSTAAARVSAMPIASVKTRRRRWQPVP